MADDEGGCGAGFSQGRGGNEGMSGAPMWQIKQKNALYDVQREQNIKAILAEKQDRITPPDPPNVLVDAVSFGGPSDGRQKPLVRHVLIKDIHKVVRAKKWELPTTGVFANKAPMGLYAIFDGYSSASSQGPAAAEFCARNFHTKMLQNLMMLQADSANEAFVKAALIKSFQDLDEDLLASTAPEIKDGCGAAVCLLIGDFVFVAVLGRCTATLAATAAADVGAKPGHVKPRLDSVPFVNSVGPAHSAERQRLQSLGATVTDSVSGGLPQVRHPSGSTSSVTRTLGDSDWKSEQAIAMCMPEVYSVTLKGPDVHPFLILASSPVADVLPPDQLIHAAADFPTQPRVACGEVVAQASEAYRDAASKPQCVAAQITLLPARDKPKEKGGAAEPPAKKAKVGSAEGLKSMRVRHIFVRHSAEGPAVAKAKATPTPVDKSLRCRQEAEALLRRAFKELLRVVAESGKTPKNPTDLVQMQTKKFAELCKEISECKTAKKGGAMLGDLGWMSPEMMAKMGGNFKENLEPLKPGQWSDITSSELGLHLVQRVA